jgi:hypothetical protein
MSSVDVYGRQQVFFFSNFGDRQTGSSSWPCCIFRDQRGPPILACAFPGSGLAAELLMNACNDAGGDAHRARRGQHSNQRTNE